MFLLFLVILMFIIGIFNMIKGSTKIVKNCAEDVIIKKDYSSTIITIISFGIAFWFVFGYLGCSL